MVAEARFARAQSETKVDVAEQNLKSAEEAVSLMQLRMQELQASKEEAEREAKEARSTMEKGKWVDRSLNEDGNQGPQRRLMSSHLPYQEFLLFVAHLRSLHSTSPTPQTPAMSTLLSLPFLVRLLNEDS